MAHKDSVKQSIVEQRQELVDLSLQLHGFAEIAYEEHQSAEAVAVYLETNGFEVERAVAGIPTAFKASFGKGTLNIGICAEYDALPNIGHACGHNVIGAAAAGAAVALKALAPELDLTISVFGTPAEEGGAGKIHMLQNGIFDGTHAAMMVHPYAEERDAMGSLAVSAFNVEYFGKPAHAAAQPEQGVSASAALALAQSGIAFLREHFHDTDRIHGIVLNGGDAPNIVPSYTEGRWFIRSATQARLLALEPKVMDVFKGAALMTGCQMKATKTAPLLTEIRTDERLAKLWRDNARLLGRDSIPLRTDDAKASTDMGNVSYAMPSIHPLIAIDAGGANIHQVEFAAAAATDTAHEALTDGAAAMAMTIIDVATDKDLRLALVENPYNVAQVEDRSYLDEDWQQVIEFDPFS